MRIFVTGATGWIGSAVVRELLGAGHAVLGLARSDASAAALAAAGAQVHRGSLADLDGLRRAAAASDGVIHTAFNHDHDWSFASIVASAATDRQAIGAMAEAMTGSDKPLVIASGTASVSALGRPGTEGDDPPNPDWPRVATEHFVRNAAGIRGVIVRLPPTVHGAGDHGFMPRIVAQARKNGWAGYVGDGDNRWPAVHRFDAARVFVRGFEQAEAGLRLHAVAEAGVTMRAIAETIGRGLDVPVRSVAPEQAAEAFGALGVFAAIDNPTSSALTRQRLGWAPREIDLLADITANYL